MQQKMRVLSVKSIGFLFLCVLAHAGVDAASAQALNQNGFEARVLIKSSNRIDYRTELNAPVKATHFLTGQRFFKGDTLLEFECRTYLAEAAAARAAFQVAEIELRTKRSLHQRQAAGKNEVAIAEARLNEAKSQLDSHEYKTESCKFEAPFDGRVVELNVHAFEFPPSDRPLVVLINDQRLEMELVVDSQWLVWLKPGLEFEVKVDETGDVVIGKIERLGAEVDPVSQTVKIVGGFSELPQSILAGMSGTATFSTTSN